MSSEAWPTICRSPSGPCASLFQHLLATDATPTAGGATRAEIPEKLAKELFRRSEVRGHAVRLDGSEEDRVPISSVAHNQQIDEMAESLNWTVESSYSFRQTSHINLQELRALKREVEMLARQADACDLIQVILCDSQVVIGATAKGRSSSFKLNGILRSLLSSLIVKNISLGLLYVGTHSNPADYPSRRVPLPPRCKPPQWCERLGVHHR